MKKILILVLGLVGLVSCATPKAITIENIDISRDAIIYDNNEVVIVTRTSLTLNQYNDLKLKTKVNREIFNNP
jgi:hypothetical protein